MIKKRLHTNHHSTMQDLRQVRRLGNLNEKLKSEQINQRVNLLRDFVQRLPESGSQVAAETL